MASAAPTGGPAEEQQHSHSLKHLISHVIHPHRTAHQRQEEATVVHHERRGARTLEDDEDPDEPFEPLVMYDAEKEKLHPPTKKEIETREDVTFDNSMIHIES